MHCTSALCSLLRQSLSQWCVNFYSKLLFADPITSVKFSQDGHCQLVSSLDNNIRLLDKDSGELLNTSVITHSYVHPSIHTHKHSHSRTHSLTHSHTQSLTHPQTQSLTHKLTHIHSHSLTHKHSHSLTNSLTNSLTYSLTYTVTHSQTQPLTHSLTHSVLLYSHCAWISSGTKVTRGQSTRSTVHLRTTMPA